MKIIANTIALILLQCASEPPSGSGNYYRGEKDRAALDAETSTDLEKARSILEELSARGAKNFSELALLKEINTLLCSNIVAFHTQCPAAVALVSAKAGSEKVSLLEASPTLCEGDDDLPEFSV